VSRAGRHRELAERVHAFIDGSLAGAGPEPFEALALDIHRWQVEHDAVLAALVEGPVDAVERIPAVPVSLFRDLAVGTIRPGTEGALFRTSGTTGPQRGAHRLLDTALYDHGSLAWAARCVPDAPRDVVALLADPAVTPDSSLSHMVALFGDCTWHVREGVLGREALDARCAPRGAPCTSRPRRSRRPSGSRATCPPCPTAAWSWSPAASRAARSRSTTTACTRPSARA